ncbi:phage portal protein [Bacillus sp. FSL W7-1360]
MKPWLKLKNILRGRKKTDVKQRTRTRIGSGFHVENRTLATNETIFAAVNRLANSMSVLPLKLYQDYRASPDHPMHELVANSPNPNQTSFDFIRLLETHRNVKGNGYAIKIPGVYGQIEQLVVLNPDHVRPIVHAETGELWYEVRGVDMYYVHHLDMIHVKHIHTNGWLGINPIRVLDNTITYDAEVRQFSMKQMNGAIESFILKYGAQVDLAKKQHVVENFRRFYEENGGILFQEPGVEIEPIKKEFIKPEVFEVEKITRSRVALVFNVPEHMLGVSDGVSYSSMEQSNLDYVQNTLMPIVRQYEQEFDRKLLSVEERKAGYYHKFNVAGLLRGDIKTRGEFYQKGVRNSWLRPNEIRGYEDLPPVPEGDILLVSKDLMPLAQIQKTYEDHPTKHTQEE